MSYLFAEILTLSMHCSLTLRSICTFIILNSLLSKSFICVLLRLISGDLFCLLFTTYSFSSSFPLTCVGSFMLDKKATLPGVDREVLSRKWWLLTPWLELLIVSQNFVIVQALSLFLVVSIGCQWAKIHQCPKGKNHSPRLYQADQKPDCLGSVTPLPGRSWEIGICLLPVLSLGVKPWGGGALVPI